MIRDLNLKSLEKMKTIGIACNVVWLFWLFFDYFMISNSMWAYALAIRSIIPLVFIPLYFLPTKFLIKHLHQIFVANFSLCFIVLFPLYFHTNYFTIYLVCSFLVPLLGNSLSTFPFRYFLICPLAFYILCAIYFTKIISFPLENIYFLIFYSSTIFTVTGVISFYKFKNKRLNHLLENQLKQSLEDKSVLVKILTHDISNMLTILGLNFSMLKVYLKNQDVPVRTRRSLSMSEVSINSIEEIIKKVKDMESLDTGKTELQFCESNVFYTIQQTINLVEDKFAQKGVKLYFKTNGLDDVTLTIDPIVFKHNILMNILTNALKFSEAGSKVIISLEKKESELVISIQDFGVGIPLNLQKIIFDPGKKTTRRGTSGEAGTGFGMPLALSCTKKMNGSLNFLSYEKNDSNDKHGTTFFLHFPITKSKELKKVS